MRTRRRRAGRTASCTSWKATCLMRATGTGRPDARSARTCRRKSRPLVPHWDAEELRGGHRPTEEEALCLLAAVLPQEGGLAVGFHALGDYGEAQVVRHLDDGAHDGGVGVVAEDIGDERAVDFQRLYREAGEVREAGVSGAEVVDREANAALAQRAHDPDRVLGVLH